MNEILKKFLDCGINISPEVIDEIEKLDKKILEKIIEEKPVVLTLECIRKICEKDSEEKRLGEEKIESSLKAETQIRAVKQKKDVKRKLKKKKKLKSLDHFLLEKFLKKEDKKEGGNGENKNREKIKEKIAGSREDYKEDYKKEEEYRYLSEGKNQMLIFKKAKKEYVAREYDEKILIKKVFKNSKSQAGVENFLKYFLERYESIASILRERSDMKDAVDIVNAKKIGRDVKIIGMVSDIRRSKNGKLILEVEDPTGSIRVLAEDNGEIVFDEVIGIKGSIKGDFMIAEEIVFPEIPYKTVNRSEEPVALALISDIHLGSIKFLEKEFNNFIKWLNMEIGSKEQRELAGKVKYIVIGGDLVDGIGIYPEQLEELVIKDIKEQYRTLYRFLEKIPDHISIIVIPGNHDAVRQAEPQPAISREYAEIFYDDPRIYMLSNPSFINIHGIDLLTFHGRSLDDIITTIPNLSYKKPEEAMKFLLKKRHLCPIYGEKVPIAPEDKDYLVIDEVPDILHAGHVHSIGVTTYRNVLVVNSGTFQEQTSFQKKHNINPTPAKVPIIDLQTLNTKIMDFNF